MLLRRHSRLDRLGPLVAAICLIFLTFLSQLPADDVGAAMDAFDRDLRPERIGPDMLNANPGQVEPVSGTETHAGPQNSTRLRAKELRQGFERLQPGPSG